MPTGIREIREWLGVALCDSEIKNELRVVAFRGVYSSTRIVSGLQLGQLLVLHATPLVGLHDESNSELVSCSRNPKFREQLLHR